MKKYKIHIKNFEKSYPDITYCNKKALLGYYDEPSYGYVRWTYPTFSNVEVIDCKTCLLKYQQRFFGIDDLSFREFKNINFSYKNLTYTSIVGAHFDEKCNLHNTLVNSIYLTRGLDNYKIIEKGNFLLLINPYFKSWKDWFINTKFHKE